MADLKHIASELGHMADQIRKGKGLTDDDADDLDTFATILRDDDITLPEELDGERYLDEVRATWDDMLGPVEDGDLMRVTPPINQ